MYEQASERWSPVQSVEKVILSVISMLAGMLSSPPLSRTALCSDGTHAQNQTWRAVPTSTAANCIARTRPYVSIARYACRRYVEQPLGI